MAHEIATVEATPMVVAPEDTSGEGSLVRLAIEKGVDVEVLERLVALQERVTERNARAAFFEAVAAFQEECPDIAKSRTAKIVTRSGSDYEYTYAPLEEIARTIRPVLKAHGLSYSFDAELQGELMQVVCVLRHVEGHEERASFPVPVDTKAAMSGAQKNGAALTYGRRQSLIAVLGLTTADPDTDAAQPMRRRRGGDPGERKISRAQLGELEDLAKEVGADMERFTGYLGVKALADLPASEFDRAKQALENKRKNNEKGGSK